MKAISIISILLLSTLSNSVLAQDKFGKFSVRGAGLVDCATFMQEKEAATPAYMMIGGWIDGYFTALNQRIENTYDITPYQSTELVAEIVANHCADHPKARLFSVLSTVAEQFAGNKIASGSAMIRVNVAQRSTVLYRETIRRMQKTLSRQGFYPEAVSGDFDPLTLAGIKEFQRSINFEPTGFPDQATLWKLFALAD